MPHGTTATSHILKPQIGTLPNGIDLSNSVENEYLCLKLVSAFGFEAAKVEIADFAGRRVLVVERFDRLWTKDNRLLRIPQEDCCQALSIPPSRKYESEGGPGIAAIASLLKGSDTPAKDQRTFFKAQVVFWAMGATDGHAKNFSVRLAAGGRFHLAPLYDVVSTQPSADAKQLRLNPMKMSMAVGKNRHYTVNEIVSRHFVETAAQIGLPDRTLKDVFEELREEGPQAIERVVSALPGNFPGKIAESIEKAAKRRIQTLTVT